MKSRTVMELVAVAGIVILGFISLMPEKSKYQTFSLDHGQLSYSGDMFNHKFNGHGVLNVKNQGQYTGNFADGRFQGMGQFKSQKGWELQDNFENGQLVGNVQLKTGNKVYERKILKDGTLVNAH